MPERAAILDIDGTLVDSNYEHVRAWHTAFLQQDLVIPQARIHRAIGMGGDKLVPHLLRCPEDDPRVKIISEAHDTTFQQVYLQRIQPLTGVKSLLDRLLDDDYRIALATSSQQQELEHYIELLDIGGYLDATVSKADVTHSKPAPDVFSVAGEKLEIEPSMCIVLGDSVWDGESARRLGMQFVGLFTGGFSAEELRAIGALAVYEDLPTLLAVWEASPFGQATTTASAAQE